MRFRGKRFWHPVFLAVGAVVTFAGGSAYFAVQFTSPARRLPGSFAGYLPVTTQAIEFPARDGVTLAGCFVPHEGVTRAVVLLHGYGSSRPQMLARAKFLHAQGY